MEQGSEPEIRLEYKLAVRDDRGNLMRGKDDRKELLREEVVVESSRGKGSTLNMGTITAIEERNGEYGFCITATSSTTWIPASKVKTMKFSDMTHRLYASYNSIFEIFTLSLENPNR